MFSYLQRARKKSRKKMLQLAAFFIGISLVIAVSIVVGYKARHANDTPLKGVSFSTKYAAELSLDYQETLIALLDDANIKDYRLMSYWDDIEPQPNEYNFEALDWQIEQIATRGGTVSLSLGQRQPRWPECHIPQWAEAMNQQSYRQELLTFIGDVVNRYKDNVAVINYQLENEAANRNFGECPLLDEQLLKTEYDLIKELDPSRQVIINTSNQSGTPLLGPIGDSVGYSIYKKAGFHAFDKFWSWNFWYVPAEWHTLRAAITEGFTGADTFIHELQAEPWGPEATVNLSSQEQAKTMDSKQLKNIVNFAEDTGMKEVYLWGGEWWYWRYTQFEDVTLWETVQEIYR